MKTINAKQGDFRKLSASRRKALVRGFTLGLHAIRIDEAETGWRLKLANACDHLLQLSKRPGVKRMDLYKSIGLSPEAGGRYLMLGEIYDRLPKEDMDSLRRSKKLLSLNQADALTKVVDSMSEKSAQRLIVKSAKEGTNPRDIERMKPDEDLANLLGITPEMEAQAEREKPKPATSTAGPGRFAGEALLVNPADFTLAGVMAALSDDNLRAEVAKALAEGRPLVITGRRSSSGLASRRCTARPRQPSGSK